MTTRLVAVATHPIQYHAPWFRALAKRPELDFEVAFLGIPDAVSQGHGFGVAFQWDTPLRDGYRSRALAPVRLPGRRTFGGDWLVSARAVVRSLRPDVLLLTGWQCPPLVQLLFAARRLKVPTLVRGESNDLRPRRGLARWLHRQVLPRVSAFLVIGEANRRFYAASGIGEERLYPAPYFVDNERFASATRELGPRRADVRAALGVPAGAICYLFAGKFEAKKRPADLLRAIARVARAEPRLPVHVLMVGAGALEASLRSLVAEGSLPVTFSGFFNQGEMPRAYVAADALVLPSDAGETWGLVVNEAMACGLPAVVSDRVGCAEDLVLPGRTGQVFPCGDVVALSTILERLAREPGVLGDMGRAAQRHVSASFTVERSVDAVVRAAREL